MDDLISRQAAIEIVDRYNKSHMILKGKPMLGAASIVIELEDLPSAQPQQIVRCKDCKHNPKLEWFGCPMSHLNEKQRPETAWCWKGERKDDE